MSGCNPMRKVANIHRVTDQARKTFLREAESACSPCDEDRRMSCQDREAEFHRKLCDLFKSVSSLTACDLGLDKNKAVNVSDCAPKYGPQSLAAPVTYVPVFEDDRFSVGAFILRPGARVPLHNHPGMHGIVKCLMGSLKVTAYDRMDKTEAENLCVPPEIANDETRRCLLARNLIFPAKKKVKACFGPDDGVSYLNEDQWNYHEIVATYQHGPSAFLDILARPQAQNSRDKDCDPCHQGHQQQHQQQQQQEARDCDYFQEISGDCEKGWLQHIPVPQDFYCVTEPYYGPKPPHQC